MVVQIELNLKNEKMLSLINFTKKNELELFEIGYLSNDANYVLSKMLRQHKTIDEKGIHSLKDLLNLFRQAEKGRGRLRSFQYKGKYSRSISLYWLLIKLMWLFSTQSYEQIQEELIEIQRKLKELINYLENNIKLDEASIDIKIKRIKKFLSILTKNCQSVRNIICH